MPTSSSPELVNITFRGKRDFAGMIKDLEVQEVILAHPGGPKYKPKGRQRERKPWLQCRRTWWDQRQGWEWCREEPPEAARGEDQLTSWSLQKEQALLKPWFQLLKTHLDVQPPELLRINLWSVFTSTCQASNFVVVCQEPSWKQPVLFPTS